MEKSDTTTTAQGSNSMASPEDASCDNITEMEKLDNADTLSTQDSQLSQASTSPGAGNADEGSPVTTPKKTGWWSPFSNFRTPPKPKVERKKLEDMFNVNDNLPSPPKKNGIVVDMDIVEVEQKMRDYYIQPKLLSEEQYFKLCWLIGKGLDVTIMEKKGGIKGSALMLSMIGCFKNTPAAHRFDTIYKSDGDEVYNSVGLTTPAQFMKQNFDVDINGKENKALEYEVYTIYSDEEHPNVEYFAREQTWGNCHTQGPILLHWLLSLWYNKEKKAQDVRMIHMSKYFRNVLSNDELYGYICEEIGGDSVERSQKLMPEAFEKNICLREPKQFEELVSKLKECGHALVELSKLKEDFRDKDKVEYYGGIPLDRKDLKDGGHGMLLVGVLKDLKVRTDISENDTITDADNLGKPLSQIWLLFQNWWKEKPFIKVRYDYFVHCEGLICFGKGKKVNEVTDDNYSTETSAVRRAVTSPELDRGIVRRLVKG